GLFRAWGEDYRNRERRPARDGRSLRPGPERRQFKREKDKSRRARSCERGKMLLSLSPSRRKQAANTATVKVGTFAPPRIAIAARFRPLLPDELKRSEEIVVAARNGRVVVASWGPSKEDVSARQAP
ncbi:unnamed protein product, partial [Phaeothamnion confervicola]